MNAFLSWIDARLPIKRVWRSYASHYPVPKNLNFYYVFGALALLMLVNQLLTGLWLTMFYTPTAQQAFQSIEYIMRDVRFGWLLRYLHSTGASLFFIVVYLHLFRSLLYGSYQKPRELVWLLGMGLLVLLMMEAFFGYLLPWGQMSYWGAQVITSLFSAIPYVGNDLVTWIRGDYTVANATLQRFFALHVVAIPLLLIGLVYLHIVSLHHVGSNNPQGIDIKKHCDETGWPLDAVPFHPYYTLKDTMVAVGFLICFFAIVFFFPDMWGYFLEPDNFIPANPMVTPDHIAPAWYMTPFYSILRAIPNKLLGVFAMGLSIILLVVLPWLDGSPVKAMRYKGWLSRLALILFVLSVLILGYLGTQPVTPMNQWMSRLAMVGYFIYFLAMPFYSRFEAVKPVPERIGL
ncbi:MAG: cytochrome b N-terminal domain-containing protein [Gammaproteobacteria bacterium]|nr:cytochrome b N-terminal domain-containing protein [Gammaproteobacteria bacterium]